MYNAKWILLCTNVLFFCFSACRSTITLIWVYFPSILPAVYIIFRSFFFLVLLYIAQIFHFGEIYEFCSHEIPHMKTLGERFKEREVWISFSNHPVESTCFTNFIFWFQSVKMRKLFGIFFWKNKEEPLVARLWIVHNECWISREFCPMLLQIKIAQIFVIRNFYSMSSFMIYCKSIFNK